MWLKTTTFLITVSISAVFGQFSLGNKGYYGKGSKDVSRRLRNLCPCSEQALKDIQVALDRYTYSVLTRLKMSLLKITYLDIVWHHLTATSIFIPH